RAGLAARARARRRRQARQRRAPGGAGGVRGPPRRPGRGARGAGAGRGGRRRHAALGSAPPRRPAPADADLRADRRRVHRHGLGGRRGTRGRVALAELRRAELRQGPPRAHHAGHVLPGGRERPAHAHLAGADPLAARARPARLRGVPGPHVPHRRPRRHPHPGVPPGRGDRDRPGPDDGPPQGHPRRLRPGHVRHDVEDPVPAVVLPLHRAVGRARRVVPGEEGRRRLGRVGRLRDGAPQRAARLRRRSRRALRVRVRHGPGAHPDVPQRHPRHARHGRGRRPLQPRLRRL
ncbi:MAG: Phenylalanyl-tRNA synthetase alpha chain, partial [uncultured Pseudonocardia sp.]